MTLVWILLACVLSTLGSMLVAFWAAHKVPHKVLSLMVAFSAGTMLSAALLNVLPEALENEGVDPHRLFGVLLISLLGFYFLERSALWRHQHAGVLPTDIGAERGLLPASYALMVGDGVHNFVDGLLIAGAFMADPWLGVTTTAAIFAHELPQEIAEFAIYFSSGWSKGKALRLNLMGGLSSLLGAGVGWTLLEPGPSISYVLMITVASFTYISLTDLVPYLHKKHAQDGFFRQTALLLLGVAWLPALAMWMPH